LPASIRRVEARREKLAAADRRVIGALVAVIVITIFPSLAYFQHFNALPVWIQDHVALAAAGLRIPVPWFQSIDSFTSILAAAPLLWLWRRQAAHGTAPGNLAKIATGSWIAAASNLVLVGAIAFAGGNPVHPVWPFLYCVGLGVAFIHYWPALLALVSRCAPAGLGGTLMGLVFVSLFFTSILMGWLGAQYERLDPRLFWGAHAAIGAAGGLLVMLFGRRLERMLQSR
jgi:POT family proton-dependent oligopeptide transporter